MTPANTYRCKFPSLWRVSHEKIIYNCLSLGSWLILNLFLSAASQAGMEFVGLVQDGQGRVEGPAGAQSVALISSDDKFVYVAAASTLTVLIRIRSR